MTIETMIIRTTAVTAFFLLHLILMIGPLSRLNKHFMPLLYNRRHLGVSMFLIAAVHGIFSIIQFHTLGDTNALLSLFISNKNYLTISDFPFQTLGFFALIILFVMAATSHDFWLKNLTPEIWKALHMGVYVAYGLIVLHVLLGALQYESHPVYFVALVLGFVAIAGSHLWAGLLENRKLRNIESPSADGYYKVAEVKDLEESCGTSIFVNGENIAVFKNDGKVSAVSNICKHQMGPLGEGKVIDGCITCPWHGYQYIPENGQSPPPFQEKLATYDVKVIGEEIWVHPRPRPEGTFVEPAIISNGKE